MGIAPYGSEYETEDDRREHNNIESLADPDSDDYASDYDRPSPRHEPNRYVVAIYELDRHYGGPEEGGWWYNTGDLRRVLKIFRNKDDAYKYAGRCNHWLEKVSKAGGFRADLSSMAYEGGYYSASVHGDTAPKDWSDYSPYE